MATFTAEQLDQMESAGGQASAPGKTSFSAEELDAMEGGGKGQSSDARMALEALKNISLDEFTEKSLIGKAGGKAVEGLARLAGVDVPAKPKPEEDTRSPGDIALEAGKFMASNPLTSAVEIGKSLLYDPELILLGQGATAKIAGNLATLAKAGRTARAAAMLGGSALEGAAVMGGMEAGHQLLDHGEVQGNQVAGQALIGAVMVPVMQGAMAAGKQVLGRSPAVPAPEGQAATPTLDRFTETVGAGGTTRNAAKEPAYTRTGTFQKADAMQSAPEAEAARVAAGEAAYRGSVDPAQRAAGFDKTANFEQQAYDLMQSGASRKKVEGILKSKSPADRAKLEAAMEELRVRRATAADSFGRAQQGEHLGPEGTAQPENLLPDTTKVGPVNSQTGAIDQTLLKTLGVAAAGTVAGLYAYARPDQQEDIAKAALGVGAILATRGRVTDALRPPSARALGPVLAEGKYTLPTLDRLPQNRTDFPVAMVEQQLKRPGVSAPERAVIEKALAEAKDGKVTAEELVGAFRRETGDHTLLPKETSEHADYGVNRLGRGVKAPADGSGQWWERAGRDPEGAVPATTTIWQLPENVTPSKYNHFADPRYYGHTRSFVEDGKRHVMEIQSDLEANARELTPEAKVVAEKQIADAEVIIERLQKEQAAVWRQVTPNHMMPRDLELVYNKLGKEQKEATLRKQEAQLVLLRDKTAKGASGKAPTDSGYTSTEVAAFKEALPKLNEELNILAARTRVVLQKLDQAGSANPSVTRTLNKELFALDEKAAAATTKLYTYEDAIRYANLHAGYADLTPALKNSHRRLVREELGRAAAQGEPAVRFATADTVAKVEGWPRVETHIKETEQQITHEQRRVQNAAENLRHLQKAPEPRSESVIKAIASYEREIQTAKKVQQQLNSMLQEARELQASGKLFFEEDPKKPQYQPIYNRYAGDMTKYLKSLGGKEVTDGTGNTWIEVPTQTAVVKRPWKEPVTEKIESYFGLLKDAEAGRAETQQNLKQFAAEGQDAPWLQEVLAVYDKNIADYKKQIGELQAGLTKGNQEQPPIRIDPNAEPRPFGGRPGQSGGPINMYGHVDTKLAALLGLTLTGAAIGGIVAGDEKLAGAILGGVTGAVAARLPGRFRAMNAALKVEPTKPRLNWKHHTSSAVRAGAVVAGGAYLGDSWDNPVEGALFGAALVLGRAAMPKAKRLTTDEFFRMRNGNTAAAESLIHNLERDIKDYVPDATRRVAIAEALDIGTPSGLSQAERRVYGAVKNFNEQIGQEAFDVGVLKGMRSDYISHIVERDRSVTPEQQASLIDELFKSGAFAESTSPNSRFARSRKYDTFTELNQALQGSGLKLKTQDVAEITAIYGKAMRRAIENKRLIDSLKAAKDEAGQNYLQTQNKRGEIPEGFKRMQHPQLQGYGVHPELYDSMRTVFEHSDPNVISRGLFGLSQAIKRSNVYASLFHAKSLAEVYLLAAGASVLKGRRPLDVALKKYREMGMGDTTELLIKQGMKIGIPDDVSTTIIDSVGKAINRGTNTKGGTAVTDKLDIVAKKLDYVTWDYMHSGVKLGVGHKEFITLMENNAKAHAKDPRVPLKSREEIAREVAGYVNDIAGGLDWYGIAAESQTALGRSVAMYFASPQGRRVAQMILFAPDWTTSTLRTAYKAFGRSETGLRGLWKPENATDLYRRYAIRSALYWITALNGLNYVTAGHSIFENDDPTRLAFPDGTSMQVGKHTFEGVHAAMEPIKFVYNKLGYLTKTPINLLLKHFNAGPMAYNNESMGEMLVKGALPFAVNSMLQKDLPPEERVKRAVVSSLGAPISGYSDQQRRARALRRRKEAAAKRFEERRAR